MAHKHVLAGSLLLLGAVAAPACGAGPVDGTWTAWSDGLAGELTLVIATQGAAVTGEGRQSRGGAAPEPLVVSGSYQAPVLRVQLKARDGLVWSLKATVTNAERMSGTLTWPTGTVQTLQFVRP